MTGTGKHRIESHLNEHPERPRDILVAALGGDTQRRRVPLHEHFGETREMTQQRLGAESALPWCGGWLIALPGTGFAGPDGRLSAELRMDAGAVTCRIAGREPLSLTWRPGVADASAALSLSSLPRGTRIC